MVALYKRPRVFNTLFHLLVVVNSFMAHTLRYPRWLDSLNYLGNMLEK